ncbi:TenA family protein [Alistipes sp.]|uniref:TenA family protein n=1 Tax=Alistipes sp. TaxID=1872444 RepID=UPI0025BF65ED|nr:TenA family protein [Alistipes sp.]MCI7140557.1 TenA family protein [Alistipes sp.]MDY5397305.1 TenA family protein [Alistipes sp.]
MTRWSDQAWEAAEPVYRRIIEHPFVRELAAGSLSEERFRHYLRQDALYLDGYARRLAHIAARLTRKEHTEAFLHFALEGIEVERALHASFLGGEHPSPDEISPTCLLYTSVLESQATAPVEVEAAAVLPCFVVYQRVGEEILARRQDDANPYRRWIETYGDASFAEAAARAVRICDELAEAASEEIRRRMTDLFVRCTRMEWMFWESAWNLEKWKI